MSRRHEFASLVWAGLGLYVAFEGYKLDVGSLANPGAGFLIFWPGIMMAGLGIADFLKGLYGEKDADRGWKGVQKAKGAKFMAALVVYVLIFKMVGFLLSTFFLLLFLFKGLEPQRWRMAIALSGIAAVFCYVVFGLFLESQLPLGLLKYLKF